MDKVIDPNVQDSHITEHFVRQLYANQPLKVEQWLRERDRFRADRALHGDHKSGLYRDIKWEIKRNQFGVLCGYVLIATQIPQEKLDQMERHTHGGFTAHLGFDCCHMGDWFGHVPGIYRDFDYVLERLHRIIDEYLRDPADPVDPEPPLSQESPSSTFHDFAEALNMAMYALTLADTNDKTS
jgi:hypothetical protein